MEPSRWIKWLRLPPCLVLLCIAVGVAAASPASAVAALPPNDDFTDAQDLGSAVTASAFGTNLWATAEAGEPQHDGPALASVWYRWTAPQPGVVRVDTCGSNFDTTLAVYRGPAVGALGRVAGNDDRCGAQSGVLFFAVRGTTYQIAVDGFEQDQGSIELHVRAGSPPSNDDLANAEDLGRGSIASTFGTNLDATVEPSEPDHHGFRAVASVWYRWTAPASRNVRVETCGSDFDTVMAVYVGSAFDALRSVASDDDSCGAQSRTRFHAVAKTDYRIAVDGFKVVPSH